MPTSRRDALKRKHTAISNCLTRAIGWTQELYGLFDHYDKPHAEGYANILVMLEQTRQFIEKLREFI